MVDSYLTVEELSMGYFKDRGSKFIGYAKAIFEEDDIKSFSEEVKKEHPKARHFCFGFRLGLDGNNYRANDDGEPSGTAGRPILGQIDSFGLQNVMIIVVRYFGGTKLGVPGLINAYKSAATDSLENATIVEKIISNVYNLTFDYAIMSDVMGFLKKNDVSIKNQIFESEVVTQIAIRKGESEDKLKILEDLVNPYGLLEVSPVLVAFLREE
jgi:uncharacterized YigZ family protein